MRKKCLIWKLHICKVSAAPISLLFGVPSIHCLYVICIDDADEEEIPDLDDFDGENLLVVEDVVGPGT